MEIIHSQIIRDEWITTWWVLWLIFFTCTVTIAAFVQLILLPHFLPGMDYGHGLFVLDSTGFHQMAKEQAAAITKDGWQAWQLRPRSFYPAGVASVFYYLWRPEPFSLIPFNAALHATAGCLVFFLFSTFITNRLAAAGGAALFVLNPASLEWTAQIHRDGTYILGNLLILTAWLLLIKGAIDKRWVNFLNSVILTFLGSLFIWASRPYWNQVAFISCIIVLVLILFYWVFSFRKLFLSSPWLTAGVLIGCLMIFVHFPFIYGTPFISGTPTGPTLQKNIEKKEAEELEISSSEIEKEMLFVLRNMEEGIDPLSIEKIKNDLTAWQIRLENWNNQMLRYKPESNLVTIKNKIKKKEVSVENIRQMPQEDLKKYLIEELFPWKNEIEKWQKVLQQEDRSTLKWVRTSHLPTFIENKLYGLWCYRNGTASSGGNTLIDPYVLLNSAGAFVRYFPRAVQIGFFSPFPTEWFKKGSTPANTYGKKLVGGIMFFYYIFFAFFIWGLWEYRKNLLIWLIVLYSILGIITFTYVYANIGTLSRMRYGFYMIIVGIGFAFAIQKIQVWKKID